MNKFKKYIVVLLVIVGFIFIAKFLLYYIFDKIGTDPQLDCLEFGFCQKGLFLKMGSDIPEEITEESCIKHNGEWRENEEICYFPPIKF